MRKNYYLLACAIVFMSTSSFAQDKEQVADSTKKATEELPLEPERTISFTTKEGTWISLDVSPDGKTIIFDLMGDLYTIPIQGGKATQITEGIAYDVHPRFSPDGKSIVFISDKSGSDNIWTMELESEETKQITKDSDQNFFSADWSPDGDYIVGAKGRRNIKLHMYHKDGGGGAQLISEPEKLKAIAQRRHVTLVQLAIGWLLRLPTVTCVLVGAKNSTQVTEHAGGQGWQLTDEELVEIENVLSKV